MKLQFFPIIISLLFLNLLTGCKKEKETTETIIGKYYVVDFNSYPEKEGFTLLNKKPETPDIVYEFIFSNNGKLIINDLTEFYDCGNGILIFNEATWKKIDDKKYEITFKGEYGGLEKFNYCHEYSLENKKNGLFLKLESKKHLKNIISSLLE